MTTMQSEMGKIPTGVNKPLIKGKNASQTDVVANLRLEKNRSTATVKLKASEIAHGKHINEKPSLTANKAVEED